jgi:hypothetical protein
MTDFETPGTRTTDEKVASYLITGPGWNGTGPTRAQANQVGYPLHGHPGADVRLTAPGMTTRVNALQAQYKIVPLSAYGKPYEYEAPPVDPNPGFSMTDAPQKVTNTMDTSTYFKLMGEAAPPSPSILNGTWSPPGVERV